MSKIKNEIAFIGYFGVMQHVRNGLVVRVSGYRSRDPGFDSRPYKIF
jgi:hypothetical protein